MASFDVAFGVFGAAIAAGLLVGVVVAFFNSWGA